MVGMRVASNMPRLSRYRSRSGGSGPRQRWLLHPRRSLLPPLAEIARAEPATSDVTTPDGVSRPRPSGRLDRRDISLLRLVESRAVHKAPDGRAWIAVLANRLVE